MYCCPPYAIIEKKYIFVHIALSLVEAMKAAKHNIQVHQHQSKYTFVEKIDIINWWKD